MTFIQFWNIDFRFLCFFSDSPFTHLKCSITWNTRKFSQSKLHHFRAMQIFYAFAIIWHLNWCIFLTSYINRERQLQVRELTLFGGFFDSEYLNRTLASEFQQMEYWYAFYHYYVHYLYPHSSQCRWIEINFLNLWKAEDGLYLCRKHIDMFLGQTSSSPSLDFFYNRGKA